MSWTKSKILRLVQSLERDYGVAKQEPRFEPMDELISCILSQHTSDANSFPTFHRLREKYPSWDQIARLKPDHLAQEIRAAGLANQKARSILGALREIKSRNGDYTLENLRELPLDDARKWLLSLPGVGPKTAAIVLCFAFGRPAIPVDTHVFRVAWRLGIIEWKLGEAKAHRAIEALVPSDCAFRFHVALIRHGRKVCKAQKPRCEECCVQRMCAYYAGIKENPKSNQERRQSLSAKHPRKSAPARGD